jgi:hypothetical protein
MLCLKEFEEHTLCLQRMWIAYIMFSECEDYSLCFAKNVMSIHYVCKECKEHKLDLQRIRREYIMFARI